MDRDFFVIRFLYASGQMFFLRRLAGARHIITGLRVSSVTLGWVGAPNERAPFRFRDAIAVFADRCLTRTRIADQGLGGFHEHCAGGRNKYPRELFRKVLNFADEIKGK